MGGFCDKFFDFDGTFELGKIDQDILAFQRDCEERQLRASGANKSWPTSEGEPEIPSCTGNANILTINSRQPSATWDLAWVTNGLTCVTGETPLKETAGSLMTMSPPPSNLGSNSGDSGFTVPDQFLSSATSTGLQPYAAAAKNLFGVVPHAPPHLNCIIPQAAGMLVLPDLTVFNQGLLYVNLQRYECLRRYREKKARRMYTKQVRYQLRKINADKRPRIKGRFIKKGEQNMDSPALVRTSSESQLCSSNSEEGEEDSST